MMNSRSNADEKLVAALCAPPSTGFSQRRKLYIGDARPRKNALANGAMGGGSESSANYLQCEVVFLGIDNRRSYCWRNKKQHRSNPHPLFCSTLQLLLLLLLRSFVSLLRSANNRLSWIVRCCAC